jgi:hypothetical protein
MRKPMGVQNLLPDGYCQMQSACGAVPRQVQQSGAEDQSEGEICSVGNHCNSSSFTGTKVPLLFLVSKAMNGFFSDRVSATPLS